MGKPSQREVVQKADIAISNLVSEGGYLQPDQVKTFMRMVQDEPTILRESRRVDMKSTEMEVNKIGFGQRVLRPAPKFGTYMPSEDRVRPNMGQIELDTDKLMCEVHIPYEVLEDNIEGDNLEAVIMQQLAGQVAIDLEEWFLLADTTSDDPYLALRDGIIKRVQSNRLVVDEPISKSVFKAGMKEMAPKYLRSRNAFRWYMSHNNHTDYVDTLADRIGQKADARVEGWAPAYAYGIPTVPASLMPETKMLLTHPKNLLWGVWRDIMIETEKDIRSQVYVMVLTLRAGMQIETEEACVLVDGVTGNE